MSPSVFGSGGQPRLFSLDDINIPQGQDSALSTKLAAEAISFDFASEPAANVSKPANNNNVVFQFRSQEDSDMLAERQQKAWRYMRPTKEPILKLSDGRGPSPAVEYNTMVDDLEYVRCNNGSAKPILNSTSIDFAFDHGAVLLPSTYSKNSNFQIGGTRKIAQPVSRLLGGRNISPAAEHKSVLDDDEYDPMQDVEDIVARDGSSSVEEIGNDLAQPQHTKSDAGSLVGLFEDTLRLQGRPRNDCVFLMAPEQTKVLVGYAIDDEFSINTHLARHYSAYFQDIITAQNPQLPHPTVSLLHLDLDRAAFRTFTRWLTQPRPLNRVQLATVFDSGPEDYEGHLVHLYRLARHLRIPMLANDSMSAFIDFCSRTGPPLVSTIVESFTKLPETSALCKFLIHLETRGSEPRGWTSEELERLPGTFRALLLRAAKMRLEKGGIPAAYLRPIRPCAYHVHHAGEGGNGEGDTATYVSEEQYLKCESELGWGWKFSTHPPVPEGWQITEARKQVVERDVTGRMSFASHMGLVPEGCASVSELKESRDLHKSSSPPKLPFRIGAKALHHLNLSR
ncbi:hypothetical protein H2203_008341 [Taxawa tesnikishii (nom. ined.)]|nr:hypothetical protein H2203_008341 [Dothideales sp. JES 119]